MGHGPNSWETPPFAYSLSSPFKIPSLRVMAQSLLKPLHSPIPCEVLLKSLNYGSWPKFFWNPSIRLFPAKSFWNPFITGHGINSCETPPFAYSLLSPFKIPSLVDMAQILLKPLHSPIPCEVLLKSLNFGSWPKFLWNPSTRLFPVKSL